MVNPLNPAAYSLTPRQGFLFDFGVEGVNFYNRQQKYADGAQTTSRTSYNTFNFHDIAFQPAAGQAARTGIQPDAVQQRRLPCFGR